MSAVGQIVHRWRLIVDYVDLIPPRVVTFVREQDFDAEVEAMTMKDYAGPRISTLTGVKIRLEERAVATYSIAVDGGKTS
jgi:hypothetical protein